MKNRFRCFLVKDIVLYAYHPFVSGIILGIINYVHQIDEFGIRYKFVNDKVDNDKSDNNFMQKSFESISLNK